MIITLDEIISTITRESLDIQKELLDEINSNHDLFHDLFEYYQRLQTRFKSVDSEKFYKVYVLLNIFVLLKKEGIFNLMLSFINKINNLSEKTFYKKFDVLEFSCILYYCVKNKWSLLKKIIENPQLNFYWKIAAMHAMSFCVAARKLERKGVVDYLKKLLCENIAADKECTFLVIGLFFIHPKETIEDIKDAYAKFLVSDLIFIDEIIDFLKITPEKLMDDLKKAIPTKNNILDNLSLLFSDEEDESYDDFEKENILVQKSSSYNQKKKDRNSFFNTKNEISKSDEINLCLPAIDFEINNDQLINEIEKADHKWLFRFFERNKRTNVDDKSFSILLSLKEKYSHIPLFYHLIDGIYIEKGMMDKSLEMVFFMVEKFPNDLMVKMKYGEYLLRRGEYDKIAKFFNNKFTLQALYPEKESFYIDDFKMFSNFMINYYATIGKFKEAHFYLHGLKQFSDDKQTISELEEVIEENFQRHQSKENF